MTYRSPLPMIFLLSAAFLVLSTAACTTNPFEPTTDTVSSTSGKTWFGEDGLLRPELRPEAFVTFNQENLRRDMAAGEGEYLTSMSSLLGVPADRQPAFFAAVQARATETDVASAKPYLLLVTLQQTAQPDLP